MRALVPSANRSVIGPLLVSMCTPLEKFFVITKNATIFAYYSSEIGIHKDLHYQGNQYIPEFLGCLTVDGKDCPHCGQKAES